MNYRCFSSSNAPTVFTEMILDLRLFPCVDLPSTTPVPLSCY